MILISSEEIQQIVEKLIDAEVSTCARAPKEVVEKAVMAWLTDHLESIVNDADWWIKNHGKPLKEYGLPYEDEL